MALCLRILNLKLGLMISYEQGMLLGTGYGFSTLPLAAMAVGRAAFAPVAGLLSSLFGKRPSFRESPILRNRDLLEAILAPMSEGVVFLAPDGTVVLMNPAAAGWFPELELGESPSVAKESQLPKALHDYLAEIRSSSTPVPARCFQIEKQSAEGGHRSRYRVCASSLSDEKGGHFGYVVLAEDVTHDVQLQLLLEASNSELRSLSEALQKNQQEMAQREKMVAIGTMAAGIAHEIGNPVACLSAVVQLLKRQHLPEEVVRHLHTLDTQIERIARTIRQMLEFARPAASEWVRTDLDELIEQTVMMVSYSHRGRSVHIKSARNRQLPRVYIMPQLFQQILVNLLLNSLDAVENMNGDDLVVVERAAEGGWVQITVKDKGIGMSGEEIRKAFEPFYTTKPPGKGTGLGLAVSYRLVERQGGRINLESSPGRGTVVTVSFRTDPPKSRGLAPSVPSQPMSTR